MKVFGIDFTSRPTNRKPITCLRCELGGGVLQAGELIEIPNYNGFEKQLSSAGPWIAGLDFPFGQSERLITNLGWPKNWSEYIEHVARLDRASFRSMLEDYKRDRAVGDKEHRRIVDAEAGSISPQKLYGVPVALMFYEGARRLAASGVNIPVLRETQSDRTVVESYPGVLARAIIGKRPYKSDTRKKQTEEQLEARRHIYEGLRAIAPREYGFVVQADPKLCLDPSGDELDALLCAVQAAWAWKMRAARYGIPERASPLEGWISDPGLI